MQLTAEKSSGKSKKAGLSRLKTGVKAAAPEESKAAASGGDSAQVAELQAQIESLKAELAAAQSVAGTNYSDAGQESYDTMPVFGYWKIRGLGAPCRMMFYYCNVNFADRTYECGDEPDYDKSCWLDVKETLGMEYPNLPYLIDGDTKITETAAIM